MSKKKVEVYDKNQLIYPYIENDHITFSNGMKVSEMLNQGISMPTITHNETSFKVGVGDSDVSSSIVDSSVSKIVIKGQTYQNILPEPSTHVLTNNKEMFKVNEGLDPVVEIVDGVSKSAILKGQTLVNLVERVSLEAGSYSKENEYFTVEHKTDANHISFKLKCRYKLHTDKNYMLFINVKENTLTSVIRTTTPSLLQDKTLFDGGFVGVYKLKFSTSDSNSDFIWLRTNSGSSGKLVFSCMVLEYQEGMENWNIPYFEGMQSVKMPVLKTTGKNLLEEDIPLNQVGHNTVNNMTRIEKGKTYTYRNNKSLTFDGRIVFRVFDEKGKLLDSSTTPITIVRDLYYNSGVKCYAPNANATNANSCFTSNVDGYIRFGLFTSPEEENRDLCFELQLEEGRVPTTYEPYKSNILTCNEEVELRGIGNVKDELNLLTGELTQRIGEIVLDGSDDENWVKRNNGDGTNTITFQIPLDANRYDEIILDKFALSQSSSDGIEGVGYASDIKVLFIEIKRDRLNNVNVDEFKQWLSQNPITVQYRLTTESVKTVDLTTSGNWEKIVLDGSEDWARHDKYGSVTRFNLTISNFLAHDKTHVFSDMFPKGTIGTNDLECINNHALVNQFQLQIKTSRLTSDSVDGLKQYLSQNPLTVWYQTKTHLDSTQVKQPIFFADGHIMQSSGADNSLIPTLDYQAKTSNSYVMDLMKTNTRYTMKAKSASGTFTIDGVSYGAGTNGTFTTPTSMTNKLLVMSNKTNTEVMILEGDVVSKTIPYFKGIKSAFEDESKIEVLSVGKNLFDKNKVLFGHSTNANGGIIESPDYVVSDFISVDGNKTYTVKHLVVVNMYDKDKKYISQLNANYEQRTFTTPVNCSYVRIRNWTLLNTLIDQQEAVEKAILQEGSEITSYEPYKSNNTKIPLLSPLRSLPAGTCDELIIDRESNKVKIIQRVGELDFSNLQYNTWNVSDSTLSKTVRFTWMSSNMSFYKVKDSSDGICDSIPYIRYNSSDTEHCRFDGSNPSAFMIWVDKSKLTSFDDEGLKKYLSTLPSTRVQYELATPVITEVDLEGFPYIYKDGHIFINGEITPVTEIKYSINQQHQIEASNQDIIRHQKEIDYLYKLIGEYVRVNYKNTLLSLNLELK